VGVFQTFSKEYDARAIRIPLQAAQELMTIQGVNTLVVLLNQTRDTDKVAAALEANPLLAGVQVKNWRDLNEFYAQTVEMYDAQFGVLRLIILVMVLLSVANSVNMSIYERVGEFGTMLALGNRSHHVFRLILAENLIIGALGALIGTLLGVVLAAAISQVGIPMPPPPNSDLPYTARITLTPAVVASAFAIGLIATVSAALLPAWRVRRIPVAEALRQSL
jgi:putative ABC transport system permease protein